MVFAIIFAEFFKDIRNLCDYIMNEKLVFVVDIYNMRTKFLTLQVK